MGPYSFRSLEQPKINKEDIRPKAADLVMMNVPEKLKFMNNRKKVLRQIQNAKGISFEKEEELRQRNIHPDDLKYLPAIQVKHLMEDTEKKQGSDEKLK